MSRNYSEDQSSELEALESIYFNELEGINTKTANISRNHR